MDLKNLSDRLYTVGTDEHSDEQSVATIQFTNAMAITFAGLSFPYAFLMFAFGYYFQTVVLASYFFSMFLVPFSNSKRRHKTATVVLLILTNGLILYFSWLFGQHAESHQHLLLMVLAPKLLFPNRSTGERIAFASSVLVPVVALFLVEYLAWPGFEPPTGILVSFLRFGSIGTVVLGILVVVAHTQKIFDLNARKLRDLVQKNQVYRAAIDRSGVCFFTDSVGKIIEANSLFSRISGYSQQELVGSDIRLINSRHHPKEFFEGLWQTITAGHVWRGEICNRAKSGKPYWVDATIVPCLNEQGIIEKYFSIRFDITQKKAAEEMLVQSAKMASLGEMAGGVAHEINTPLAVNKLLAEQIIHELGEEILDTDKIHECAVKIDGTVDRIATIVKSLRRFSKNASGDAFEVESVNKIFEDVVGLCGQRFQSAAVELTIELPRAEVFIDCRPTEIVQVMINFLGNAFDAIEALPQKWVTIRVEDIGDSVQIGLTDAGGGIPREVAAKLFQPFFTTKGIGRGTGLGLSISRGIIQSHNGTISLDADCANTRFVIVLPKHNLAFRESQKTMVG